MKTKKIIIKLLIIIWIFSLFIGNAHANLASDFMSSAWDSLLYYGVLWINYAIWFLIAFIAGVMTFWILFISYVLDLIFIKVPYIWDIIGEWWDVVYIQTVQKLTSIVLLFSIAFWLFLWWTTYIKDVIDKVTNWLQSWSKWSIYRDVLEKFVVVLLIFSIPFSLPVLFKWINSLSWGILAMEISTFKEEDRIVILSKPLTSLVELWIWIPAVDWLDSNIEENEWKEFISIHNQKEWDWIENWQLKFSKIFNSIADKSLFQFWRFLNLAWTIIENEWLNEVSKNYSDNIATNAENLYEWAKTWLILFLMVSILYIILLYIVFMKLFALLMSLVTRFVNIIMTSMYLSFHIAMLGSDSTKEFWKRNIWSFVWDILVTPLIAAYLWISILILWFFASVVWAGDEWFMYFWVWGNIDDYQVSLFTWMLVLIILWGMLNKLQKLVEYVWSNFENIISIKWWQWMKDSYSNPWEAMNAAWKVFWLAKTTWWMLSFWMAWKWIQNLKNSTQWYVSWNILWWNKTWMIDDLKNKAVSEWLADSNKEMLNNLKEQTITNNTKINKK
jgi:hypothetical protein